MLGVLGLLGKIFLLVKHSGVEKGQREAERESGVWKEGGSEGRKKERGRERERNAWLLSFFSRILQSEEVMPAATTAISHR